MPTDPPPRPLRADARRNREKVLAAAREAFAVEGPAIGLDEIARRAGVGAGTVHRHFPTKEELFSAVIADRLTELAEAARELAEAPDPGQAFFSFLAQLADAAAANAAISSSFTGGNKPVLEAGAALVAALGRLQARAQAAGALRKDVDVAALHALLAGAIVAEQRLPKAARGLGVDVLFQGLRPVPRES
jgi:AcrR family transcriptional regulator